MWTNDSIYQHFETNTLSCGLTNYAHPFIRYSIGDRAEYTSDLCNCGRGLPLISNIEGRIADTLETPDGRRLIVHWFTFLFEHIYGDSQFQLVQSDEKSIRLLLVLNSKFDKDKDLKKIIDSTSDYIGPSMNLKCEIVDEIPLVQSGKRRFIIKDY